MMTPRCMSKFTFYCLDEFDKNQFQKYVTAAGEIKVRKTAQKGGMADLCGYLEIPVDEKLREEAMSGFVTIEKRQELPFASQLPTGGKLSVEAVKTALAAYVQANRETIYFEYQLETTPFFGTEEHRPKYVWRSAVHSGGNGGGE